MSTIALLFNNSPVTWTGFHIFGILEFSWKALEKSWKYHGILFWKVCGHPAICFRTGDDYVFSAVTFLVSEKGIRHLHCVCKVTTGYFRLGRRWARMAVIASVNYMTIGSNNGLSPARRQAIIWTNADMLTVPFGATGTKTSGKFKST